MKYIKVKKIYSDVEINQKQGTFFDVLEEISLDEAVSPNRNSTLIIKEDCNVYTDEGKLLLKFRKNRISKDQCEVLLII